MSSEEKYINAGAALGLSLIAVILSFVASIIADHTNIGTWSTIIWPKYKTLQVYCNYNYCIMRPKLIATIYTFAITYPIGIFLVLSALGFNRIPSKSTLLVRAMVVVFFITCGVSLILSPFDFETEQWRFYENSVSSSYFGLARPFWPSLFSTFLIISGYLSDKRRV